MHHTYNILNVSINIFIQSNLMEPNFAFSNNIVTVKKYIDLSKNIEVYAHSHL